MNTKIFRKFGSTFTIAIAVLFSSIAIVGGFFVSQAYADDAPTPVTVTVTTPVSGAYWRGTQNIVWGVSSGSTLLQPLQLSYSSDFNNWANSVPIPTSNLTNVTSPLSWNISNIADGIYRVRVSGNVTAPFGTSNSFYIDNATPTTVFSTTTSPDSATDWYNATTLKPVITLTCTDPVVNGVSSGCSGINYAWYSKATGDKLTGNFATTTDTTATTASVNTSTGTAGTASITIPSSNVPQGDNILKWSSEDNAVDNGGTHNISTTHTQEFKVDTIAPIIDSISPANNSFVHGSQTFTFNFSDANNLAYLELDIRRPLDTPQTRIQVTLPADDATIQGYATQFASYGVTSAHYDAASQTWTVVVDTTNSVWRDGNTVFSVEVGDVAGNQWGDMNNNSTWGGVKSYNYIFDNTAPAITATTLTAPNGGEDFAGGSSQTITWNTSDITDTNLATNPITLSYSTNSNSTSPTWTPITTTGIANSGTYSWTVPTNVDSTNVKVKITATDLAGNTSSDISDSVFTIDSTNPTLSPVSITSDNANTSYAKIGDIVTLSFTSDEAVGTPVVTIDTKSANVSAGTATNAWTATYKFVGGETEGSIPFTIDYTDIAGNAGAQVTSVLDTSSVTYDQSAPIAPIIIQIGATGNYINSGNVTAVHVTGTAEAGSTVSVALGDGTATTSPVVTGIADSSSGAYDITVDASGLIDGTITATVNATDPAGNTGVDTTNNITATKDVVAPTVTSITTKDANNDGSIDTATIVFDEPILASTFTASDFTIGSATVDNVVASSTASNVIDITLNSGNEVAGTDAKDVTYTQGTATDIAGNALGAIATADVTEIDGAGPVLLSAKTISTTQIDATFSEKIDSSTVNGTGSEFTVGGVQATSAVENTDGVITLTVATMNTGDTPDVTYTSNGPLDDTATPANTAVSPVTVTATDGVAPVLTAVSIVSNNASTTLAKAGNIVTLNFTSSEAVDKPTVTIDGKTTAVVLGGPTSWTATLPMLSTYTQGNIPFTIDFVDIVSTPNAGIQVTIVTDSSSVFFDSVPPTASAGVNREVNSIVTSQGAIASDSTPNASGLDTYAWTVVSGPTSGVVTFSNQSGTGTGVDTNISADTDGTYILKLTVTDKAGNESSDTMTFIWDTTNPVELSSTPSNGNINVPSALNDVIVTFNESVTSLDTSKVMFTDVSTGLSAIDTNGTVAISGNTIVIPHTALNDNVEYRINVLPGAVTDIAGNNLTVNFNHNFTTSATPDTTPPAVPVITTSATTAINANYYTITGTDASDGGQRIINLYNGSTLAGSFVLASGQTAWSINAALTQGSANVFTAKAVDGAGNESSASSSVIITEADPVSIPPTVSLVGDSIATSYTVSEATTRFGTSGLQFDTTNADSITVNGTSVTPASTITVATPTDATTIGTHAFYVAVTSTTGNTANIFVSYLVTADPVADTVKPVIDLLDANPQTITKEDSYTELGAVASDNVDGDIATSSIVIDSSAVDTSTAGTYKVTYDVTDSAGNNAVTRTRNVIVINPDAPAVIPTVTLNGGAYASSYSVSEAEVRFADGLEFNTTDAESFTINGETVSTATPIVTAKTKAEATALGIHVYNVVVTSSTGDTANVTVSYEVVADPLLKVVNISASSTTALADDSFENGWSWIFDVTVPINETAFSMKFKDFKTSDGDTIPASNNIRFYSAQSSDSNSTSTATMITAAETYPTAINLNADLDPSTPGRQIKVVVEMKVPTGSTAASYSSQYAVKSE